MANPTARIFATERLACIDNPLAFVSGLAAAMVDAREFAVVVSVARGGAYPGGVHPTRDMIMVTAAPSIMVSSATRWP
jgi:hypothetical protein